MLVVQTGEMICVRLGLLSYAGSTGWCDVICVGSIILCDRSTDRMELCQ